MPRALWLVALVDIIATNSPDSISAGILYDVPGGRQGKILKYASERFIGSRADPIYNSYHLLNPSASATAFLSVGRVVGVGVTEMAVSGSLRP